MKNYCSRFMIKPEEFLKFYVRFMYLMRLKLSKSPKIL